MKAVRCVWHFPDAVYLGTEPSRCLQECMVVNMTAKSLSIVFSAWLICPLLTNLVKPWRKAGNIPAIQSWLPIRNPTNINIVEILRCFVESSAT